MSSRCSPPPNRPGISSPDRLHTGGEPYTFIHLLEQVGVTGGESLVTDNKKTPKVDLSPTGDLNAYLKLFFRRRLHRCP